MQSPLKQVPGLDLIRCAAAAMVMTFHLAFASWAEPLGTPGRIVAGAAVYPELAAFNFGWIGVEVFFVLSGFVIAYSAATASPAGFLRARFLRLAPGAWVCATITLAALLALGAPDAWARWAASVLFFPVGPWVDGVYWTLAIEIAFYTLVFALLWVGAFRHVVGLAWALCLASTAFVVFRPFPASRLTEVALLEHGMFFALGVFLWAALTRGLTVGRVLGAIACLPGCLLVIHHVNAGKAGLPGWTSWGPGAVWLIAVGLMVMACKSDWRVNPTLARRIGLATYPLYLLHDVCGAAIIKGLTSVGAGRWTALGLAFAAVAIAAWLVVEIEAVLRRPLRLAFDRAFLTPAPATG